MSTNTRTVYRDSGTGKILSKEQAAAKNPNTVEKERIKYPAPSKTKKSQSYAGQLLPRVLTVIKRFSKGY